MLKRLPCHLLIVFFLLPHHQRSVPLGALITGSRDAKRLLIPRYTGWIYAPRCLCSFILQSMGWLSKKSKSVVQSASWEVHELCEGCQLPLGQRIAPELSFPEFPKLVTQRALTMDVKRGRELGRLQSGFKFHLCPWKLAGSGQDNPSSNHHFLIYNTA